MTTLEADSRAVVRFYNKRGTAEQWIKEGKLAVKMTRLSCHRFRANEVRLALSVIAYNLGNLCASRPMRTRSVGVSPTEGQARPLVAWAAEGRETDHLKPADKAIFGMASEPPGRSGSERAVASKTRSSGGRAIIGLAKAA